jgi:hypothetical protein
VEELTVEREEQKALLDTAVKAKSTAEAKTEALLSQVKGYDREFDRLLERDRRREDEHDDGQHDEARVREQLREHSAVARPGHERGSEDRHGSATMPATSAE